MFKFASDIPLYVHDKTGETFWMYGGFEGPKDGVNIVNNLYLYLNSNTTCMYRNERSN